ncbi:MAG TPA: hypothetical protein VKT78_13470 [Fimbriimonadaceae bacterium]|nr:hypothetical protein [Fimbriimonadaceae bacterium]
MESIDPIAPIAAPNPQVNLRIADTNKDGRQRHDADEKPDREPHDVLELHVEEGEAPTTQSSESEEPPSFGLDLAV